MGHEFTQVLFLIERKEGSKKHLCSRVWCFSHRLNNILFEIFFFFFFLEPHLGHVEVPRPGVQMELQLLAYTTATATQDPNRICNLHHSSRQRRIPNSLSKVRVQTHNLLVPSRIHFCCTKPGTPEIFN